MANQLQVDIVDVPQLLLIEQGSGRLGVDKPACTQSQQSIAVTRGQVNIVDNGYHALIFLIRQPLQQLHHFKLMLKVQRRQWFVQQDIGRILGKQHGNPYTLALAAR